MPEASAGEVIVGHLDDYFRIDWFPFAAPFRTPSARSAGSVAREARRLLRATNFFVRARFSSALKAESEPDVMEQSGVVIKAEQSEPISRELLSITKTADHAIDGANLFRSLPSQSARPKHRSSRSVWRQSQSRSPPTLLEPFLRLFQLSSRAKVGFWFR